MTLTAALFLTLASAATPETTPVLSPGQGSVAYNFRGGVYPVTNTEYAEFLNAVASGGNSLDLWYGSMRISRTLVSGSWTHAAQSGWESMPVQYIRFFDAIRYSNWLHNGKPAGAPGAATTEDGAYTIGGHANVWREVSRNGTARWFLPSQDEYDKLARHQPATNSFSTYSTGSSTAPTPAVVNSSGDVQNPGQNTVNYNLSADWDGQNGNVTAVGDCQSLSGWGAYDMHGNVHAWTDRLAIGYFVQPGQPPIPTNWDRVMSGSSAASPFILLPSFLLVTEANIGFRSRFFGLRLMSLCPADFNNDSNTDSEDLSDYSTAFENGDPACDMNFDGFVDFFDYDKFIDLFENC